MSRDATSSTPLGDEPAHSEKRRPNEIAQMSRLELHRELGLRRWARRNYIPAERRPATWHPIVLEEMRCRDTELETSPPIPCGQRYVPLLPNAPGEFKVGLRARAADPVAPPSMAANQWH